MPAKRKAATKGRKRYKRKSMPITSYMKQLNRNPLDYHGMSYGIPLNRSTTLRYSQTFNLTSTSGILAHQKFKANGLHDPDYSTTGHQPFGFDQYKLLYNHYIVSGSRIKVHLVNSSNNYGNICGIYLDDDTSSPAFTDSSGFIESNRGTYKLMPLREAKAPTISSVFDCKRFFNIIDVKDNVTRLGKDVNGDPGELAIYNIWYQSLGSETGSMYFVVLIEYDVHFSEPIDLGQS